MKKFSDGVNNIREIIFNCISKHLVFVIVTFSLFLLYAIGHVTEFFVFGDVEPMRPFYLIIAGGIISTIYLIIAYIGVTTIINGIKNLAILPIIETAIVIIEKHFRMKERENYRKIMKLKK